MDEYAGRVLADRYRLPLPPADEYELTESLAFDTYSGQEVLVRQVPLPEVVEAEVLDADGLPEGFTARERGTRRSPAARAATRQPTDPAVRRALEAAQAAARIPDHPRLDQVFDVFAEGGSLWIVSEAVSARPLSALLAEQSLTPYRAAEVASDVLMALRVLHAHGWVHRNVTARTVLVCDDGRVMLTGLAVGAAEEALCGYDPVPAQDEPAGGPVGAGTVGAVPTGAVRGPAAGGTGGASPGGARSVSASGTGPGPYGALAPGASPAQGHPGPLAGPGGAAAHAADTDPEAARRAAIQARAAGGLPAPGPHETDGTGGAGPAGRPAADSGDDIRAARAGAIAAYRAGARAAARVQEDGRGARVQGDGRAALPAARPPAEAGGAPRPAYPVEPGGTAPGRTADPYAVADPYGVQGRPWHGASPRTGPGGMPAPADGAPPRPGPPAPAPGTGSAPAPGHPYSPAPAARTAPPALPAQSAGPSRWDAPAAGGVPPRGPGTAIAAERARQLRMTVVGPVTERWAPEQAGPVHENWQLAAPIGPATDLWALGALLFRTVQGHAPYPEESTAELVQLVCAEPPAFAEECGPLRPVVESLLRQDPTDRPDFEELSGWLRSLVRSAPEPDAGINVVPVPPADPRRLPIVRRRGELVRRRRRNRMPAAHPHARHKRAREEEGSPRRLGRLLLVLILLLLAGAVAYAMLFLPGRGESGSAGGPHTGTAQQVSPTPSRENRPPSGRSTPDDPASSAPATGAQTDGGASAGDGFTLRQDPDGFTVAVAKGWSRTPRNDNGQVLYAHGDFTLLVVPGRDSAGAEGSDPMVYQRDKERELQPYRDSSWATASGLRTIEVGGRTMAEGQFTWTDAQGRDLYVRNMAMLIDGRYHIVQLRGPEAERDEVTRLYEQATSTYRFTGR
ncbi:protein kinase [Streptomyces sp. NPDC090108]|uniref:protein kinase n=1 Tax=Streptomyces sp. NPDC090108 TaxID=3365947 RepID=UPI00382FA501